MSTNINDLTFCNRCGNYAIAYDSMVNEIEYEFDNVDDSIFVEPDASEYLTKEQAMENDETD